MRRALTFVSAAGLAALVAALVLPLSSAEITGPLGVQILFPGNDTVFAVANFTAIIGADGQTADATVDDFVHGTFVNTSFDGQGLRANGSANSTEWYYDSQVFEHPLLSHLEWSTPLDFLTSGSSANLTPLLQIEARTGDRSAGRNWSAWFPVDLGGDLGDPRGPSNESLLLSPAFQYRIRFLDPHNASTLRIVLLEVWSVAPIVEVAARIGERGNWTTLGAARGLYNFSVTLAPGASKIEARVTDASGAQRFHSVAVAYDIVAPTVESAPPTGSSIPPDSAAEIRFSEAIDPASASVNIVAEAPFAVDLVWSADNRTLFVSAQESGRRGPVKITISAGLRDRAGNTLGAPVSYTYEMGAPPQSTTDTTGILVALFAAIGVAGLAALYYSSRAKKRNEARAQAIRGEPATGKEPSEPPK